VGKKAAGKPSFPQELYVVRDVKDWIAAESYEELMELMVDTPIRGFVSVARYRFEGVDKLKLCVVRVDSDGKLVMVE